MQPVATAPQSLFGYVLHGLQPSREPANKWFVSREEYPGDESPDFLSGWLYVTTPGVARALVAGALAGTGLPGPGRRYFWIDDLLLTGLVRAALGWPQLRNASALYTTQPEVLHCCVAEPDLRCDVLVGPNGGDNDLIVRYSSYCLDIEYRWRSPAL